MAAQILKITTCLFVFCQLMAVKAQPLNHEIWDDLLQEHVSPNGQVNYDGFIQDYEKLTRYITHLQNVLPDIESREKSEQLAFWINAYNACTVRLICDHMPLSSIKDINRPWKKTVLTSDGTTYTLDDIEHDILRKMQEPRIHFAINCASFSCPQLAQKAYTGFDLESQLDGAAQTFLRDSSKNNLEGDPLILSKIFFWFKKDFGTSQELIVLINNYTGLNLPHNSEVIYRSYDWSLNH